MRRVAAIARTLHSLREILHSLKEDTAKLSLRDISLEVERAFRASDDAIYHLMQSEEYIEVEQKIRERDRYEAKKAKNRLGELTGKSED